VLPSIATLLPLEQLERLLCRRALCMVPRESAPKQRLVYLAQRAPARERADFGKCEVDQQLRSFAIAVRVFVDDEHSADPLLCCSALFFVLFPRALDGFAPVTTHDAPVRQGQQRDNPIAASGTDLLTGRVGGEGPAAPLIAVAGGADDVFMTTSGTRQTRTSSPNSVRSLRRRERQLGALMTEHDLVVTRNPAQVDEDSGRVTAFVLRHRVQFSSSPMFSSASRNPDSVVASPSARPVKRSSTRRSSPLASFAALEAASRRPTSCA
jgi:hypothetical protein